MQHSSELTIGLATQSQRLYPGDILVTRSKTFNSFTIAGMTMSAVSHAVLVVNEKFAVEAVPDKIQRVRLSEIYDDSTSVIHLRHKRLLYAQGLKIAEYALAQVNKSYDMGGAFRAGMAAGCNQKQSLGCMMVQLMAESMTEAEHDETFFCSELVGRAYESVGLHLVKERPWMTLPGGLLKSNQLVFMRKIK